MTPEAIIAHVDDSIARALRGESHLDPAVLDIKGFSTATQRHLVSNLAHDMEYLEVGIHVGSSFCAALSNNPSGICLGIENWSQPFGVDAKSEFEKNMASIKKDTNASFGTIERDCFDLQFDLALGYDMLYFDSEHSFESHAKALPYFIDSMAETFVYMVDDHAWPQVAAGTCDGFERLKGRIVIEKEWHLTDHKPDGPLWHNDVYVAVIRKI